MDLLKNMTSKFNRIESSESLRLGKYWRSITGIVQSRRYRRTQGNAANDSLTQGTTDRTVKEFLKKLNACVVGKGGHFYYYIENTAYPILYKSSLENSKNMILWRNVIK